MNMNHMKHIHKIILTVGLTVMYSACTEPETPAPNVASNPGTYVANFLFVNATPDSPTLSFFVNNVKTGPDAGSDVNYAQLAYAPIVLTSSGAAGSVTANTNIRVRAASGTIGGVLGSNDLIYRAGNTNANNFVAVSGNNYTVFAVDSLKRPAPVRTLNSGNFGDVTWYNPKTGAQISVVQKAALTDPSEIANLTSIGVVPLGSSDVGGVRFYVTQDVFPAIPTPATQAAIRLVNAVPNANNTTNYPSLSVRLRPAAGPNVTLGTNTTHVMNGANFNPSVGTRTAGTTGTAFTNQVIGAAGVGIVYTLEASRDGFATVIYSAANVQFTPGRVYTVVMRGYAQKQVGPVLTGSTALSHAIVTHY
jgi:hypothetical protein